MAISQDMQDNLNSNYGNIGLGTLSPDQLQFLGLQKYVAPTAKSKDPAAGMPGRIARPELKQYEYNQESLNYPTWLKNLGEQQAQQDYQRNLNMGVGAGGGAQALQRAQDARNRSRMGYMAQAGQESFNVQNQMANQQNIYNDLLARLYGMDINQRGQDMSYLNAIRGGGGGGGGTIRMGGRVDQQGSGGFIGMGGRSGPSVGTPFSSYNNTKMNINSRLYGGGY